jgi:hypothetical protein
MVIYINPYFDNRNSKNVNIYRSKIANVPTPGYAGHTSVFIKSISYLNKDKLEDDKIKKTENCELSLAYMKTLNNNQIEEEIILY